MRSNNDIPVYKIGFTRLRANKRKDEIKTGNPKKIEVLYEFKTDYGFRLETALHNLYSHKKEEGEWFVLDIKEVIGFMDLCQKLDNNFKLIEKFKEQ